MFEDVRNGDKEIKSRMKHFCLCFELFNGIWRRNMMHVEFTRPIDPLVGLTSSRGFHHQTKAEGLEANLRKILR